MARLWALAGLFLASVATAPVAQAQLADPRAMPLGDQVAPPIGFVRMCERDAFFCEGIRSDAANPIVTAALRPGYLLQGRAESPAVMPYASVAPMRDMEPYFAAAQYGVMSKQQPGAFELAAAPLPSMEDIAYQPQVAAVPEALPATLDALLAAYVPPRAGWQPQIVEDDMPTQVAIAPDRRKAEALLEQVNLLVNRTVAQISDVQHYGAEEYWERSGLAPGASGDCEDLAIEKRIQLIERGFPADRLSFAVVFSRRTGLHTVLLAQTDAGDVVLDSRIDQIVPWEKARYVWLAVQAFADPMVWRQIG